MRVMLDTNIFISMIFFPSAQTRKLARRLTDSHQIVVCDYVIEELRLVTDRKFPAKRKFLDRFFLELPFELVYGNAGYKGLPDTGNGDHGGH